MTVGFDLKIEINFLGAPKVVPPDFFKKDDTPSLPSEFWTNRDFGQLNDFKGYVDNALSDLNPIEYAIKLPFLLASRAKLDEWRAEYRHEGLQLNSDDIQQKVRSLSGSGIVR